MFGVVALTVAAFGVYGLLSALLAQRTHDMSVRLAPGASPARLMRQVLAQSLRRVGLGLGLGLTAAFIGTSQVQPLLFGTYPFDARVFALAVSILVVVAVIASLVPAWRASTHRPDDRTPLGMSRLPALVVVAAGVVLGCRPAPEPAIGVRNAHALAYDGNRGTVVLFGGANDSQVQGDTWLWNGDERVWRPLATGGPDPRTFPAMAWDEVRHEVVLFGGNRVLFGTDADRDTFLGDTWVLDAAGWSSRSVAGPSPRAEAALAFDPSRGRIVLFGGYYR